jgi:formylmethanofuran dehydrogenase subunit E
MSKSHIGWWMVKLEIQIHGERVRFDTLSDVSREHILQCIKDGRNQGDLFEEMDNNPFKGREDERNCHCNNCGEKFREGDIAIKDDVEYCPFCGKIGYIADDKEE